MHRITLNGAVKLFMPMWKQVYIHKKLGYGVLYRKHSCRTEGSYHFRPFFFVETITAKRYQHIIELFIASLEPGGRYCWLQ